MTQPLTVNIPHQLGKSEAQRRVADGFATVQQQLQSGVMRMVSFQNKWEGDRLEFVGSGLGQSIRGRLSVQERSVEIEIELPAMLAALADRVKGVLKAKTQLLLEEPR